MSSANGSGPAKPSKTCDVCKLRHQKCDSSRPWCQYCALRDLECVYSRTPAHQVTGLSVRRRCRNPQPSSTESLGRDLPWPNGVKRSGSTFGCQGDLGTQPQSWNKRRRPSAPTAEETSRATSSSNLSPASPFKASVQQFVAVVGRVLLDGDGAGPSLSLAISPGCTEGTDVAGQPGGVGTSTLYPLDRNALPPHARLQRLLDSFLDGPNKMISVCEPSESQNQLNDLYRQGEAVSDASLSLILLQLAIGAQNLDSIPDQICSTLYDSGRRAMEVGIEKIRTNWLWVVQAHVLDCIYSMNARPNMCWVILGSAIRISQTYHIDDSYQRNSSISPAEHSKWRQVWLGIVCLDAWLSTALGRLPQINQNSTCDPFLRDLYMEVGLPTNLVQANLARLSVIAGGILRDVYAAKSVNIYTYEAYVDELERWFSALPPSLRFHVDHTGENVGPEKSHSDRIAIHNLELVYLDTMLLVTRPLLLESTLNSGELNPSVTQLHTRLYAQTCVDTANQISHLSSFMKDQGLLVKRSWPVIHAIFHAALVLFTSVSPKESVARYSLTGDQLQPRRQTEHDGLAACVNALACCAMEDKLAEQYLSIAKHFQNAMFAVDVELHPEMRPHRVPTTISHSMTVGLSSRAYDYFSLPALIHNSTSQTNTATSMSYKDADELQGPSDPFGRTQDWFIGPNCSNLKSSNTFEASVSHGTWSATSYEPHALIPVTQYASPYAGYATSHGYGAQPMTRH